MDWTVLRAILVAMQHMISVCGILIIFTGIIYALYRYIVFIFNASSFAKGSTINEIRMHLGRTLILGLEFIVAADLIGSTTTPDYYDLGMLAIIVAIRTLLTFSINRELIMLNQELK